MWTRPTDNKKNHLNILFIRKKFIDNMNIFSEVGSEVKGKINQ